MTNNAVNLILGACYFVIAVVLMAIIWIPDYFCEVVLFVWNYFLSPWGFFLLPLTRNQKNDHCP